MEEEGVIIGFKDGRALVKTEGSASCQSCKSVELCQPSPEDNQNVVEVENSLGACKGDKVVITIEARELLKTSMMVYLFPLILFIGGVLLGGVVGESLFPWINKELFSLMLGVIMLVAAFRGLRTYGDKKKINNFTFPRVTRVL
jgi:sigma-E factor negative regulatory protein RseC